MWARIWHCAHQNSGLIVFGTLYVSTYTSTTSDSIRPFQILNWTSDARELHENLVKLQEQIYPPAKNDGEDRLVEVRRDANAVHGVTCKECGEQVVGVRYKCGVCPNHDICSECEANGVHDKHITFRFSGVVSEVCRLLDKGVPEVV